MTDIATTAGRIVQIIWFYIKNIILNMGRRGYIFFLYVQTCALQQRLRRKYRRLGEKIITLREAGDINPLLHEQVKDQFEVLDKFRGKKTALYEKIALVRERIKNTTYSLPGPEEG